MRFTVPLVLAAAVAVAAVPSSWGYDWATVATVSDTVGINAGHLCVGLTRGDIGCAANAPTVDGSGNLTVNGSITGTDFHVTGNLYVSGSQAIDGVVFANGGVSATGIITATAFVGDGSGLTGMNADRITSGTSAAIIDPTGNVTMRGRLDIVTGTGVVAVGYNAGISNTADYVTTVGGIAGYGNIGNNLTALGYGAGYKNTGNGITAVGGSAGATNTGSGVTALGYLAAQYNTGNGLTVVGHGAAGSNAGYNVTIIGSEAGGNNTGNDVTAVGSYAGTNNSHENVTLLGSMVRSADKDNQVVLGNGLVVEVSTSGVYVGKGISTTGGAFISGTLTLSNGGEACNASHIGAIKYESGAFYICQDTAHGWEALATTGANSLADRITSGTTQVITNGPGNSISFTVGGVTTGYFYNGQLVANGVSTTGAGKFNNVSVTTDEDIGRNLTVAGHTVTANVSTTGDVSVTGNVSANKFIGDGSLLTNISASAINGLTTDRIVSGTSAAYISPNGDVTMKGVLNIVKGTGVVAVGQGAASIGSGDYVTAVGYDAAISNTADSVTAVGYFAGTDNKYDYLTTMGYFAGSKNIGAGVTSIGFAAGQLNAADYATLIGYGAGYSNTGSATTALGYRAARVNTGYGVTAVGYNAGIDNSFTNVTLLGYGVEHANKNNQVVLGNGSVVEVSTSGILYARGVSTTGSSSISGTLKIADGGETCDASRLGAIRYSGGAFAICQSAANGWEPLATLGAGSLADRITSGTTQVITNGPGNSISFTVGGVTTGYFYNGQLVASAVSTTGPGKFNSVSVTTNGYFGGNIGIGMANNTASMVAVSGTSIFTDSLGSYAMVTPGGIELFRSPSESAPNVNGVIDFKSASSEDYDIRAWYNGIGNKLYFSNNNADGIGSSGEKLLTIDRRGLVGIGDASSSPSTVLDVAGTLKIAASGEACDTSRLGAIKYDSGTFSICQNTTDGWQPLATTGGTSGAPDRIVSGSAVATIDPSGTVKVRGLLDIITGNGVVGVGQNAALGNTNMRVTAVGYAAGMTNTGVGLTALGSAAGSLNTGANVTALGYNTGSNNTGDSVTVVGRGAGMSNTFDNVSILGANANADKDNQVVLGDGNVVEVSTSGILYAKGVSTTGSSSISGTLKIANGGETCDAARLGAIKYDSGTFYICQNTTDGWQPLATTGGTSGAPDRIISGTSAAIIDPTGVLTMYGRLDIVTGTQVTAVGYSAGKSNTGSGVTAIGYQAGENNTSNIATSVGLQAGQNNSGANFTAVGYQAGQKNASANVTAVGASAATSNSGVYLTAVGALAGYRNTGIYATALGYSAGYQNTGDSLVAVGYEAGQNNSGGQVTALGYYAGQNNSVPAVTALGYYAGRNNTGANLTALGNAAGLSNSGTAATALGSAAGEFNTGGFVTMVGYQAGISNTFSNATLLGYQVYSADKANQVVLGNGSVVEVSTSGIYAGAGVSVTGVVQLADGGQACDAARLGAIKYASNAFYICQNTTNGWEPLATTGASSLADRITSGTTQVITNGPGNSISFTVSGVTTGYFYNGQLVASAVSTTGPGKFNSISVTTNGTFGGNVGIGTTNPSATLDVRGQIIGGFGGQSTSAGTLDWNGSDNARIGNGFALLAGNAPNGPGSAELFHAFSFGYKPGNYLDDGNLTQFAIPYVTNGALANGMFMRGRNSGTWTPWHRFLSDDGTGQYGIGTILPTVALEVSGTISATHFVGDGSGLTGVVTGTPDRIISGTTSVITTNNTSVTFTTAGTNQMTFGTDGNLNIGAPIMPSAKLNFANMIGPKIQFWHSVSGTTDWYMGIGVSSQQLNYTTAGSTNSHVFYAGGTNNDGTELMRIQGNGRVGIATSSPTTTLDVSGSIKLSNGAETCTAAAYGTMRFVGGVLTLCRQ